MEIVMSIMLGAIIILLLFLIFKLSGKTDQSLINEKLNQMQMNQYKTLVDFNQQITSELKQDFTQLNQTTERRLQLIQDQQYQNMSTLTKHIHDDLLVMSQKLNLDFQKLNELTETRLLEIDNKVNHRLMTGFEKTNEAFNQMLQRLAKIDEAQKNLSNLSSEIISLQSILGDKKTRGIFGEVQLTNVLEAVFGKNDKIYSLQYRLTNGTIVDALLKAPQPLGYLAIDSKFPLENYIKMTDRQLDQALRSEATKAFTSDVKKHIDAICQKYIIANETSNQAIMFIPAEAIFAEINAYHQNIVEYAQNKRVWIVSPTTLMSTLTTIQVIIQNIEQSKYAHEIQAELAKLAEEFNRYQLRWEKLSNQVSTVYKSTQDLHVTTNKINKRFENIVKVEAKEIDSK